MNYFNIIRIKLKNPSLLIKMMVISILFIYAINIELPILSAYSVSLTGKNQLNFLLFTTHIFSYFEIYSKYLLVGLILIIPDILDEPFLTHHFYQYNKNRKQLFKNTVLLILSYVAIFLLWFVLITFLIFFFKNGFTSLQWPIEFMYKAVTDQNTSFMHIPGDAMLIPLPIVFLAVLLKVTLGFFVLCLACFFIAFKKNNMSYGIIFGVTAYFISDFLYFNGGLITWGFKEKFFSLSSIVNKFTLAAFFTYEKVTEKFLRRFIETLSYELILIVILLYFINKLIKNKDLG